MDKIAQSLSEQLPTKLSENLLERKNKIEKLGVMALSVFGLGVLGFLLYGIVYKLMLTQGNILGGLAVIGLVIMIGCAILSVILFAKAEEIKKAATQHRLPQPTELPEPATPAKLLAENHHEPMPSVAEHTTELLCKKEKRHKRELKRLAWESNAMGSTAIVSLPNFAEFF